MLNLESIETQLSKNRLWQSMNNDFSRLGLSSADLDHIVTGIVHQQLERQQLDDKIVSKVILLYLMQGHIRDDVSAELVDTCSEPYKRNSFEIMQMLEERKQNFFSNNLERFSACLGSLSSALSNISATNLVVRDVLGTHIDHIVFLIEKYTEFMGEIASVADILVIRNLARHVTFSDTCAFYPISGNNIIFIESYLANLSCEDELNQTLAHEYVHVLYSKSEHEFSRYKMRLFGLMFIASLSEYDGIKNDNLPPIRKALDCLHRWEESHADFVEASINSLPLVPLNPIFDFVLDYPELVLLFSQEDPLIVVSSERFPIVQGKASEIMNKFGFSKKMCFMQID